MRVLKKCPDCGRLLPRRARFCGYCGQRQPATAFFGVSFSSGALRFLGIAALTLVVGALVIAILHSKIATPSLVVDKQGRGQYTTIGEAIKSARPGAHILVRPGLYNEGLVIDKPLEIIGDGLVEEIIIESTDSGCILMKTEHAAVRGLTLRGRAGLKGNKYYAVDIPQGRLVLEDCEITSDSLSCVAIHGSTANPVIRRCRIHDGKQNGIFVWGNGQGTIEDCDIFGNAYAGVAIREGGNPIIRRCQIHDGKQGGVFVYEEAQGMVEDCDIFSNAYAGVEIREGGNPVIRRCQIHDGKSSGISVWENGQGTAEDCNIFGNASAGVSISEGGNPVIRGCKINRNGYGAVWVSKNGAGTVENCDLTDNARGPWNIEPGCEVRRSENIE